MSVDVVKTVIYSSMLGATALALADACSRPKQLQTRFLIALLLFLMVNVLGELYLYSGAYRFMPALAGAQLPIRMLMGPALYFYAYATMSPNKALPKNAYLLALLGPLLAFLAMVPFAFGLSSAEKLALADPLTRDPKQYKIALLTCFSTTFIFIFFTACYLVATLKLHHRHCQQLMDRFSSIERKSMGWFRVVLLLWGAVWFMHSVEYILVFMKWRWFGAGVVLPLFEALVLMAFAHLALKQPVLKESDKGQLQTSDIRSKTLGEQKMAQIAEKLKKLMLEEQMFMVENLSLNMLSKATGISENHISETLSQHLKTNFFHFVNSYRIELATRLLGTTEKLVSTIAYEVGFNSKSTFNAAFKKHTGLTPSTFKKQQKSASEDKILN